MFIFVLVSIFLYCFTGINGTSIWCLDDTEYEEPHEFIDYRVLNAG